MNIILKQAFNILKKINTVVIIAAAFICMCITPAIAEDNSIRGQLSRLEAGFYNQVYAEESVIERLDRLEIDLFGEKTSGSIFQRLSALRQKAAMSNPPEQDLPEVSFPENKTKKSKRKKTLNHDDIPGLMSDSFSPEVQNDNSTSDLSEETGPPPAHPQQEQLTEGEVSPEEEITFDASAPDYFDALMHINEDRVIRFKNMPLKIYLPAGDNITYQADYRLAAIRAFNIWKLKSGGAIDYVLVDRAKKADIIILWQDHFPEMEGATGTTTTQTGYNLSQYHTGNIISNTGYFVPGYYGYGASLLGALVGRLGNERKIRDVKLRIGTMPSMKLKKDNAMNLIESITSHEFGHAIGLTCHSNNPLDIMYPQLPSNGAFAKLPAERDINTAIILYNTRPDFTD